MPFLYTNGLGNTLVFNQPLVGDVASLPGFSLQSASASQFTYTFTFPNGDVFAATYLGTNLTYANGFLSGGTVTDFVFVSYFLNPTGGLPNYQLNPYASNAAFDATNFGSRTIADAFADAYGGDDIWFMDAGGERADGYGGDDTFYAFAGFDIIDGGEGDDRIFGASESFTGGDFVAGPWGFFTPSLADEALDNEGNALEGGIGDDLIVGGDGGDFLSGERFSWDGPHTTSDGDDALFGRKGNDYLEGSSGDDLLVGGQGADTLFGGVGDDTFAFIDWNEVWTGGTDTIVDFSAGDQVYLGNLQGIGSWIFDYLTLFTWQGDSYAYYDPTGAFDINSSILMLTMINYTGISDQDFAVNEQFLFY